MEFPTIEEFAKDVAEKALDEYEYKGKTLRQWIEIILGTDINVATKDGTKRRMVNGYPIDADLLMMKVGEEYGDRARDRIYQIIRYMPKYEQPLIYSKLERLTDKEQRIFLAAMGRERKVCKEVDDQYTHEPYEVLLTKVCSEIERKVKKALWS